MSAVPPYTLTFSEKSFEIVQKNREKYIRSVTIFCLIIAVIGVTTIVLCSRSLAANVSLTATKKAMLKVNLATGYILTTGITLLFLLATTFHCVGGRGRKYLLDLKKRNVDIVTLGEQDKQSVQSHLKTTIKFLDLDLKRLAKDKGTDNLVINQLKRLKSELSADLAHLN